MPSVAFAQTATDPGEGTDLYRVNREVEAMTRDGRWQRLLDEASGVRQAVTPAGPFPQSSTHTPVRPRALAELRLACQRRGIVLAPPPLIRCFLGHLRPPLWTHVFCLRSTTLAAEFGRRLIFIGLSSPASPVAPPSLSQRLMALFLCSASVGGFAIAITPALR
jgi:hypothetical protein